MKKTIAVPANIDAYIAGFPADVQKRLQRIRSLVRKTAPQAEEAIRYGMPAFLQNGHLVLFAAYQHHIGFYRVPTADPGFAEDLRPYKTGSGSVQFPLDQPLPVQLIVKIIRYNMQKMQYKAMRSSGSRKRPLI